jgi:hypothetical protein
MVCHFPTIFEHKITNCFHRQISRHRHLENYSWRRGTVDSRNSHHTGFDSWIGIMIVSEMLVVLGFIPHSYHFGTPVKGKAVPIQDYYWPIWFQEIGSSQIRQSAHESCKVVRLTHRPPLPSRKHSYYSFLLDAQSYCGRKNYVNEEF